MTLPLAMRSQGEVVAVLVVIDRRVPDDGARPRVEGDDVGVDGGEVDAISTTPPAVGWMQLEQILGSSFL